MLVKGKLNAVSGNEHARTSKLLFECIRSVRITQNERQPHKFIVQYVL